MSLFVRVRINRQLIGNVEITNETHLTDLDSTNTYQWTFVGEHGRRLNGTIQHRYGDGAFVLSAAVMDEIAARYRIAAAARAQARDA